MRLIIRLLVGLITLLALFHCGGMTKAELTEAIENSIDLENFKGFRTDFGREMLFLTYTEITSDDLVQGYRMRFYVDSLNRACIDSITFADSLDSIIKTRVSDKVISFWKSYLELLKLTPVQRIDGAVNANTIIHITIPHNGYYRYTFNKNPASTRKGYEIIRFNDYWTWYERAQEK